MLVTQPVEADYGELSDQELTDLAALQELIAQNDAIFGAIEGAWVYMQKLATEQRQRANKRLFVASPHPSSNLPTGRGSSLSLHRACSNANYAHTYEAIARDNQRRYGGEAW